MSSHVPETLQRIVEWVAFGIELLAVAVIVGAVILAVQRGTIRYLFQIEIPNAYENYRNLLGRALLLGLELMVAADVVRTVTFDPTLKNVGVLGLLVVVRTLLGWTMSVEVEGCWPWQLRTYAEPKTSISE